MWPTNHLYGCSQIVNTAVDLLGSLKKLTRYSRIKLLKKITDHAQFPPCICRGVFYFLCGIRESPVTKSVATDLSGHRLEILPDGSYLSGVRLPYGNQSSLVSSIPHNAKIRFRGHLYCVSIVPSSNNFPKRKLIAHPLRSRPSVRSTELSKYGKDGMCEYNADSEKRKHFSGDRIPLFRD